MECPLTVAQALENIYTSLANDNAEIDTHIKALKDALAAARHSLELHPWFRPGVQAAAHLLHRAGREADAVELLTEAAGHLESGVVAAQLAGLQLDLGRHEDARRSLERYAELSPLMEPEVAKWLAARRADHGAAEQPVAAGHQLDETVAAGAVETAA